MTNLDLQTSQRSKRLPEENPGKACLVPTTAEATEPLTYKVQYFRTGGSVPETEYPYVVIVQSAGELADYISTNDKDYNFRAGDSTDTRERFGLYPSSDAYNDAFFSKNTLLIVGESTK